MRDKPIVGDIVKCVEVIGGNEITRQLPSGRVMSTVSTALLIDFGAPFRPITVPMANIQLEPRGFTAYLYT